MTLDIKHIFNRYPWARIALRKRIIRYFASHGTDYPTQYREKALSLKESKLHFLPSELVARFKDFKVAVFRDNGMPYVVHNGKRLYFKSNLSNKSVSHLYRGLIMEQDPTSPHCYQDESFNIHQGDIILDLGAAEALFTLDNIEKLEHAYIFECDSTWIPPLQATFEPWKDRVTIIQKYVSGCDDERNISIDQFMKEYNTRIDFIKMDLEGEEVNALMGAQNAIEKNNIRIAACCYHRPLDYEQISDIFANWRYNYTVNPGLLCFKYHPYPPYFRRGVIKGHK